MPGLSHIALPLSVSLCAALSACTNDGVSYGCTAVALAGLRVDLRDSVTNAPYTGQVIAKAIDSSFRDSASTPFFERDSAIIAFVVERPGTYRVEVSAASYSPWSREGVTVTKTRCHVNPVTLTAKLRRPT